MRKILKLLKKSNKIALFSHVSPDPDTIGSTLALFNALKAVGKDVSLFCDAEMSQDFAFLTGFENYNKNELSDDFDLFVAVDVASSSMLGKFEEKFVNFENTCKIDHHSSGTCFAKNELVVCYSACAILIFELLSKMKSKITVDIASCLYFGICGDTGLFRNNNTDSKTFDVCSKLFDLGADFRKIYSEFFDKRTVQNVFLTSNTLLNASLNDEKQYVVMQVSAKDFEKFGVSETENIGNLPNTFLNCGYKIAVILKEKQDGIHCSFRSKFEYDVSKIAEVFGGGGHKNASGCTIAESLEKARALVQTEIEKYLGGN